MVWSLGFDSGRGDGDLVAGSTDKTDGILARRLCDHDFLPDEGDADWRRPISYGFTVLHSVEGVWKTQRQQQDKLKSIEAARPSTQAPKPDSCSHARGFAVPMVSQFWTSSGPGSGHVKSENHTMSAKNGTTHIALSRICLRQLSNSDPVGRSFSAQAPLANQPHVPLGTFKWS